MKKLDSFLFLFFLITTTNLIAQIDSFPFAMGIPEGEDIAYHNLPVKARLTNDNYRSVGSKASLLQYAPTPQTQGKYGTCTAWAAGFCARTILEAQRYGWTRQSLIDSNTFSPGFIYRVTMPQSDCSGAYVSTCFERLKDTGIPKFKTFREQCPDWPLSEWIYLKAAPYKIKGFATLWNRSIKATPKQKIQLLKKSIDEGNPVVIAMIAPKSFCSSKGPIWYPNANDTPEGNQGHAHGRHAVCLIAYDDDKDGGSFLIQNSWGSWWGAGGYMWIRYKEAAIYIYQAIEMFKLPSLKAAHNKEVKLAGALRLIENTGQEMKASLQVNRTYKLNKAYRSGTRFRLYLNNRQAAYVYAIATDQTQKISQIFPHKKGVSPYLNYSYNTVPIPNENQHIRMDGRTGTDYICVLYSQKPLNIAELRKQIAAQDKRYSFQEKIKKVLGDQLMSQKEVIYTSFDGEMSFSAKAKNKTIAALFMEMEHID